MSNQTNSYLAFQNSYKPVFLITKTKKIHNWTREEDSILIKYAARFDFRNWKAVSRRLKDRSAVQCSARYKRIKPGIIKGAWTEEEDRDLLCLLQKYGKNWSLISKHMNSRSGKQIRDRYLNTLDPHISKDKFTEKEDRIILKFYSQFGTSWSKIAKFFPKRTGDMIKNRFYSSLRKKGSSKDHKFDDLEINATILAREEEICKDTTESESSSILTREEKNKNRISTGASKHSKISTPNVQSFEPRQSAAKPVKPAIANLNFSSNSNLITDNKPEAYNIKNNINTILTCNPVEPQNQLGMLNQIFNYNYGSLGPCMPNYGCQLTSYPLINMNMMYPAVLVPGMNNFGPYSNLSVANCTYSPLLNNLYANNVVNMMNKVLNHKISHC